MRPEQDHLPYPIATADLPGSRPSDGDRSARGQGKLPDFSTFKCDACAPSERFVCDE
jgi:hypothetical protein